MLYRVCILFCCCFLFGCGNRGPYNVRAVVTLDDKPLAEAEVLLIPIQENVNTKPASGITDTEGVVMFKTEDVDGVFSGSYIVTVSKKIEEKRFSNNEVRAFAEVGIRLPLKSIEFVPEIYTRRETSDLKAKVGYWHSKDFMFNLQSEK